MGRGSDLDDATSWTFEPIVGSAGLIQPSTTPAWGPAGTTTLVTFFRDQTRHHVYRSTSHDGASWSAPVPTELPNNDAGIEAILLSTTALALAFNPVTEGRDPLALALSTDGGETWPCARNLQHGNSTDADEMPEFSYPSLLQTPDGMIHLTYTYNRETIKYKRVDEAWVRAACGEHTGPGG